MLGVVQNPHDDPADQLLRELGEELGVGDTYKKTPVGVYFGEPGEDRLRPVLRRRGTRPHGLPSCAGAAWSGCPHGAEEHARQELPLSRREARRAVMPEQRTVMDVRPIGERRRRRRLRGRMRALGRVAAQGPPRAPRARRGRRGRARWAPTSCCSAAAWTARCRAISSRLGELVRTNSESILTVTVPEDYPQELIKRVAITSSIYPDPNTHIETVTYGDDGRLDAPAVHAAGRRRHAR